MAETMAGMNKPIPRFVKVAISDIGPEHGGGVLDHGLNTLAEPALDAAVDQNAEEQGHDQGRRHGRHHGRPRRRARQARALLDLERAVAERTEFRPLATQLHVLAH